MDTHRSRQSQQQDPTAQQDSDAQQDSTVPPDPAPQPDPAARHRAEDLPMPPESGTDPGTDPGTVPKKPGRGHGSIFDRIDSTVRVFLGPADRSEGDLPVVHRHDEAEDFSEETLGSIEIHEDSLGHHYAQQRRRPEQ
ncbi:hypothetical protein [uncultured Arthrobacter sp.]|uniref:hypothetical protein n=1 Tax=uncultured Arthrobacter sp. TaxID=114050 RepID=UPI00260811D2|nr:hypothetical protein [uncultured Arthrobacter sp.]